jgi:hypothetical protein
MSVDIEALRQLIGQTPSSADLAAHIATLAGAHASSDLTSLLEVKAYPDAVYFNYTKLGMSILFKPAAGYTPKTGTTYAQLAKDKLLLDSIDVYNAQPSTRQSKTTDAQAYSIHPGIPMTIPLLSKTTDGEDCSTSLEVASTTTGKDFVASLGEPDRKGGGAGPSSGSIGIWCEWSKYGLMVEFGGDAARGPQAWERGKDAPWKVMTIFEAKPS